MELKSLELMIFDLDYTLIDSGEGIIYCFNEARKQVGEPPVAAAEIRSRIGLPIEDTFKLHGSADPDAMRERFREIAREGAMAERSFLLEGVKETISRLSLMGHRLAVASTKSRAEIIRVLEHLKIIEYFEEFCGSDEVRKPKPAADPLIKVMARTGTMPDKVVYVGDHIVDIRSARAAGVKVVIIEGGPCKREDLEKEQPDLLLASFKDILNY